MMLVGRHHGESTIYCAGIRLRAVRRLAVQVAHCTPVLPRCIKKCLEQSLELLAHDADLSQSKSVALISEFEKGGSGWAIQAYTIAMRSLPV